MSTTPTREDLAAITARLDLAHRRYSLGYAMACAAFARPLIEQLPPHLDALEVAGAAGAICRRVAADVYRPGLGLTLSEQSDLRAAVVLPMVRAHVGTAAPLWHSVSEFLGYEPLAQAA